MKNNRSSLKNLTVIALTLMAQLLVAQTIGDGPGGLPSSNIMFWYNSSNVRQTTGIVPSWYDSKVVTNYLSPSAANTLTYNASGFTATGDNIPFYSMPSATSLSEVLASARTNQAVHEIWVVAKSYTANALTGARTIHLFKINNVAAANNYTSIVVPSAAGTPWSFQELNTSAVSMASINTTVTNTPDQLYYATLSRTATTAAAGIFGTSAATTALTVSNSGLIDFAKLTLNQTSATNPYNNYAVAEVFGFTTTSTTPAQKAILQAYIARKYFSVATDVHKFDYVETNSTFGATGSVNSGVLKLSTTNTNKFAVAHDYQGAIAHNLAATLPSPFNGLKVRNEEWKVITNAGNSSVTFSIDASILNFDTKSKVPFLIVKSATNVVSNIYSMTLASGKYSVANLNVPANSLVQIGYMEATCTSANNLTSGFMAWNTSGLAAFTSISNMDGLTVTRTTTGASGVLSLTQTSAAANTFSAVTTTAKLPIEFSQVSSKRWCVSKIGDPSSTERFSLRFSTANYGVGTNYNVGYNIIVDPNGDDVLTDAVIYTTSQLVAGVQGVNNVNLPNGAKISIALDIFHVNIFGASTTSVPPNFFAHSTLLTTATYGSFASSNDANLRRFHRVFNYTGANVQAVLSFDKRIFNGYFTYATLQPYQVPVIIESSTNASATAFSANAKVYACTAPTGNIYTFNVAFKTGYYYTLGIIDQQTTAGYTNYRATSGLLDLNYNIPQAKVDNEFRIFSSTLGVYNHIVALDNAGSYTLSATMGLGTSGTMAYIPYKVVSKAFKVLRYNNTSTLNIGFHKSLISSDDIPDEFYHALIIDTDGNWTTTTNDRTVVGLVKSGDYYFALDQNITTQSFALGLAKQSDVHILQEEHEVLFSNIPTTLPTSQDLIVNTLKNFQFASSCTQTINNNYLKLLVNTGETFQWGLDKSLAKADFSFDVTVDLTYKNLAGATIGTVETKTLNITGKYPEALYSKLLPAGTQTVTVSVKTITSNTSTPTVVDIASIRAALEVKGTIVQDIVKNVPKNRLVSFVNGNIAQNNDKEPVMFTWSNFGCPAVEGYKFQLLRLYNNDAAKTGTTTFEATADVDWSKALTLETTDNELTLQLAEGTGYYMWRVMPYGNTGAGGVANSNNWGNWTSDNLPSANVLNLSGQTAPNGYEGYVFYHNQLENDKNFTYNRVFTEQGKSHETFTIANGLREVAQTQSKLNSNASGGDGSLIIAQNVYDYSGRIAITSLPAPILDADQAFGYRSEFIKEDLTNNAFGPWSVDVRPDQISGGNYVASTVNVKVSDNSLLGKYYSDQNPDTRVPNAEKYPFSRVVYSVDGNNDIIEQGNVGGKHQPFGGKTVKKNTAAASPNELIRLFGDETPEGVVRTSITDQNGITSISYTNRGGKTIATCLLVNDDPQNPLKKLPSTLDKIEGGNTANPTIIGGKYKVLSNKTILDKIENQIKGNVIVSTQDFELVGNQSVAVDYTFQPTKFQLNQCDNFCVTCGYKVEIYIYNLSTGTLQATAAGGSGTAMPILEWLNPSTYPNQAAIDAKIANYGSTPIFTLGSWTGASASATSTVTLPGGSYRFYKVVKQSTEDDAKKVATDVENKMNAVVQTQIIDPIKAKMASGSMKFVNQYIFDVLLTSYITAGASEPSFGTYVELIRTDVDGNQTALLANSKKTSSGSYFRDPSMIDYKSIKDDMKLKIVTSCCTMYVQLFEHRPDFCSPKEYLTEGQLLDQTDDYLQLYQDVNHRTTMMNGLSGSLVEFTRKSILDNAVDANSPGWGYIASMDPIDFLQKEFSATLPPTYTEAQFLQMTKNMITDYLLWKVDYLTLPTPAARDQSKYKIYEDLTCENISDSWKSLVQRYFAPIPNAQRDAMNNASPSAMLSSNNPGVNLDAAGSMDTKVKKHPIDEHLSNVGYTYIGYVTSGDIKTQAYKLFTYIPRNSKCETMFCAADMNAGYNVAKMEENVDVLNGEKPAPNLEPASAYPDIDNPTVRNAMCRSYMTNTADPNPCMPETEAIGTSHVKYLGSENTPYNTLKVKLLSQLAVNQTVYRYLNPIEYNMLKKCDEADDENAAGTANGSIDVDDIAIAETENSIRKIRDDLLRKCNIACEDKYNMFYAQVAKMYDADGDGQYYANAKRLYGAERIKNFNFDPSLVPFTGDDGNNTTKVSGDWRYIKTATPIDIPAAAFQNGNIDIGVNPIYQNVPYLLNQSSAKTYAVSFEIVDFANITDFRFKIGPWNANIYKPTNFIDIRNLTGSIKKGVVSFNLPISAANTYSALGFIATGTAGAKLVIDNVSVKEITHTSSATLISADDICCTARSLVEGCKDDCKLTEKPLVCDPLPVMKAQIYYRTNLDIPATWKRAGGVGAADIVLPTNTAGVYPGLSGTNAYNINLNISTKQYYQLYIKSTYNFSNGKSVEVKWGKNYAPQTPLNLPINITQQTVTLANKGSEAPVFTLNDGQTTYNSPSRIAEVYKYLEALKTSASCTGGNIPAVTLTSITYSYSYDGRDDGVWTGLPGASATVPMRDPDPKVTLEMKVRFIYTTASGTTGEYKESCITKMPLGEFSGTRTYSPYFGLNKEITTYNGASSILNNITGTKLYLGYNTTTLITNPSACEAKDMFKTQYDKRRILVAPGSPAELRTVNSIINPRGGFLLKPYCNTSCPSTSGYGLVDKSAVSSSCGQSVSKPVIKWQNTSTQLTGYPDNIFVSPDQNFNVVSANMDVIKFDKNTGAILDQKYAVYNPTTGVDIYGIGHAFKHKNGSDLILCRGKIYNPDRTLYKNLPNVPLDPACVGQTMPGTTIVVTAADLAFMGQEFSQMIIPYDGGYILYMSGIMDNWGCINGQLKQSHFAVVRLDDNFNPVAFPGTNAAIKFVDLNCSLSNADGWLGSTFVTYDNVDQSFVLFTEVRDKSIDDVNNCKQINTHGNYDVLGTKFDKNFNTKKWQKLYGGEGMEIIQRYFNTNAVLNTDDGGYIFAVATRSTNVGDLVGSKDLGGVNAVSDFPYNAGDMDVWVVKIDKYGNKVWDKSFGGNGDDYPVGGLIKYKDYYVIAAKSFSAGKNSDPNSDKIDKLYGYGDSWVFVIDKNGKLCNDISLGGYGYDYPLAMNVSAANNYVMVSNTTNSSNNDGYGNVVVPGSLGANSFSNNWFVALDIPINTCSPQPVYLRWLSPTTQDPPECTLPSCKPCPDCVEDPPVDNTKTKFAKITQTLEMTFLRCKGQKVAEIMEQYTANCIKPQQRETFSLQYNHAFHHYTLYYYDRGGNLIKTVPPAGVEMLPLTDLPASATPAQINTYKASLATLRNTPTSHRMATLYTYNNLGQLVEQTTPDGGKSTYMYDRASRLRFSQSAQQNIDGKFSYTKYDALSRIIEAGEATYPSGVTSFDQLSPNLTLSQSGTTSFPTTGKTEYTVSVYSKPMNTVPLISGPQRHLQNRLSYSYAIDIQGRRALTYYSYDVHGNVEWIIQDIPGFSQYLIAYEYDLVSNKVTKVSFNKGRIDAFYHKYDYDADNRIVAVYTSKDGEVWDKDASYDYFKHGPLKRTVLGEDRVQGLDYTYTIHGWLKAINSHNKGAANDPSKDGDPGDVNNPASKVAVDEWAMMLQYYTGDFKRTSSPFMETLLPSSGTTAKDLYNGNITAWHSRVPEEYRRLKTATPAELASLPILTGQQYTYSQAYTYDELNRIVASEAFKYTASGDVLQGGSSFAATEDYKTSYSYDASGNLLTLNRNGYIMQNSNGKDMDKFRYQYPLDGNSKPINNKLRGIDDDVTSDVYGNTDLNDQAMEWIPTGNTQVPYDNYSYDANGNLVQDKQGKILVKWNAYGKVSEVIPLVFYTPVSPGVDNMKPRYSYTYDAQGNRLTKETIGPNFGPGYSSKTTAYVRDASGNVLSVYEKQTYGGYDGLSHEFKQKEIHLYGSSRLGMYTPNKPIANLTTVRDGLDRQYYYEDVQQRTESNNVKWLQHVDKSQVVSTVNKTYRYLTYATQTFNTTNSEYMDANNTISNMPAIANKNVFQAEDKAGNILFSGFVAKSYMGKPNVCMIFTSTNALMKNSGGILIDPNSESVVVQIPNSSDYMLISRGLDKKLYYHTINLVNGVLTKNIELLPGTTNYGTSIVAVEDFAQSKVILYTSRFDIGTLTQTLVAIAVTKPSGIVVQSINTYPLGNVASEECQIKIAPRSQRVSIATFNDNRLGFFDYRYTTLSTFNIGQDYRISDLDVNPNSAPIGGYYQPRSYQFELDKAYELPVESAKLITGANKAPILLEAYGPLMRRPDGNLSAFYNINTPGQDLKPTYMSRLDYGYFVIYNNDGAATTVAQVPGSQIVPYTHVSNFRKYAITVTDPTYVREVGAKSYELTDHLGNVSVVLSDLAYKVYPSNSSNTKVVLATATKPEGLYGQVLSYTNYYPFGMAMVGREYSSSSYRYGFNGKEKSDEVAPQDYDFGARIYDSRIGRWMGIDDKAGKYPSVSPFGFALDNPILCIDPDGKVVILYDEKGNKVATISNAKTVIEKGMENSAILKSYVATKAYFNGQTGSDIFAEFEDHTKILSIRATAKPEGAANFQPYGPNSGAKDIKGIDQNGNKTLEVNEITEASYQSDTEFGSIEWNPLIGGIDAEGNRHSPAMIFIHELLHAKHFKDNLVKFLKDGFTNLPKYGIQEEKNAIDETNAISKTCGNGDGGDGVNKIRKSHGSKGLFKAKSTTSNQAAPAPKPKVQPKK